MYVKGYKRMPFQKLSGKDILAYSGKIIAGVETPPPEYDEKKDYYFGCDCDYPKWMRLVKTKSKNNRHV